MNRGNHALTSSSNTFLHLWVVLFHHSIHLRNLTSPVLICGSAVAVLVWIAAVRMLMAQLVASQMIVAASK